VHANEFSDGVCCRIVAPIGAAIPNEDKQPTGGETSDVDLQRKKLGFDQQGASWSFG